MKAPTENEIEIAELAVNNAVMAANIAENHYQTARAQFHAAREDDAGDVAMYMINCLTKKHEMKEAREHLGEIVEKNRELRLRYVRRGDISQVA